MSAAPLPLEPGDRLTREEFERRYDAMPHVKKAELIEGVVYMPSPVRHQRHSRPHFRLIAWLGAYDETARPRPWWQQVKLWFACYALAWCYIYWRYW